MPEISIEQAVEIGLEHHRRGQLREAEQIYQHILKHDPRNADALHLLGVLAHQGKRSDLAIELISRAIQVKPEIPVFHYNLAEAHSALGRKDDAVASYRRAIDLDPDYFEANNNLGNTLVEMARYDQAEQACRRAIEIDPQSPSPHNNLGNVFRLQNRPFDALDEYEKALALRENFPEALNNLGITFAALGRFDNAITTYRKAIAQRPLFADAHNNLGNALIRLGRLDEAIEAFRTAIQLKPDAAQFHNNFAAALKDRGRPDIAIDYYRDAIKLRPDFAVGHNNLSSALKDLGRMEDAEAEARKAIELKPDFAAAWCNLGLVMRDLTRTDEAVDAFREALRLEPESTEALSCLGFALLEQGKRDDAIAAMRRSLELKTDAQAHSNLLLALNYHPELSPQQVFEEHQRFGEVQSRRWCTEIPDHTNDRSPERRLRIGYVSPDFRGHAVSFFILPILENHNADQFEIFCYANLSQPDAVTLRVRTLTSQWREIKGLTPQRIAEMVRADQIDILVDLAGHTANNSLPLFTCKPAPIQMSWIGYPNTTGLSAIDYRITDPFCDPPGQTEHLSTERLLRLPESVWCYKPPPQAEAPVGALPADANGHITFGSVNNFAKITPQVLDVWAKILFRIPDSRLLMHSAPLGHPTARNFVTEFFSRAGISPSRITLKGWVGLEEYFETLTQMDLTLDPFPFNGGTTTCHTLWAGLPTIALAGANHVSRMGVSILSNVGLTELIAQTPDHYVDLAVAIASDRDRLRHLRATMRARMQSSPLMNGPRLTRHVEDAYRSVWRQWCAR